MSDLLHVLGLIVVMAIIHRLRGGWLFSLPFKLTYYIWMPLILIMWLGWFSWQVSIVIGLTYLIWSLPGWMREASLGHTTAAYNSGRKETFDEVMIDKIDFHNHYLGLLERMDIWLVFGIVGLWCLGHNSLGLLIVGPVSDLSYWLGWRYLPKAPSNIAEWGVGAAYGLGLAVAWMFTVHGLIQL